VLTLAVPALIRADDAKPSDANRLDQLEKENQELRRRIELLEEKEKSAPETYVVKESVPEATLNFIKQTEISGFVSGSYTYNFNNPKNDLNTGRGYDNLHDQFMFNKLAIILAHDPDYNAFNWKVGYYAELIFGQDARFTQAAGLSLGSEGDLEQGYVVLNVPIGYGLKVVLGKFATVHGYEAVENERAANWSSGNQWTVLEPFTHTGIKLDYKFNDQWDAQFMVFNGWDIVDDNNDAKSFMGRVGFAPNDKTSFTLVGFGGPEQDNNDSNWRKGVDFYVEHKLCTNLTVAVQIDYGHEDGAAVVGKTTIPPDPTLIPVIKGDAQWWGAGIWLIYDWLEQVQFALRGDYVNDIDGARTSDAPVSAPFPINRGQELYSIEFTVNLKPVEKLRIAPNIRWDHSTLDTAFNGHSDQITVGVGAVAEF
jgi:hypothetical protein